MVEKKEKTNTLSKREKADIEKHEIISYRENIKFDDLLAMLDSVIEELYRGLSNQIVSWYAKISTKWEDNFKNLSEVDPELEKELLNLKRYIMAAGEEILEETKQGERWNISIEFSELANFFLHLNTVVLINDPRVQNTIFFASDVGIRNLLYRYQSILTNPDNWIRFVKIHLKRIKEKGIKERNLRDFFNLYISYLKENELLKTKVITVSEIKHEKIKTQQRPLKKFPIPRGVHWQEISIEFISNDSIKISAKDVAKKYTYAEIGFKDARKIDSPDSIWKFFKKGFASHNGEINWKTDMPKENKNNLKKVVSQLRKRLRAVIEIEDDPFYLYYKVKGYKTKFNIKDNTPAESDFHS